MAADQPPHGLDATITKREVVTGGEGRVRGTFQ